MKRRIAVTAFVLAAVTATLLILSIPAVQEGLVPPSELVYGLLMESRGKLPVEPAVYRDVVYRRSLMREYRLDVYEPLADFTFGEAPAIVFFHGGSWLHGDKATIRVVDRFLRRMREQGYFIIAANYTTTALRGLGGPAVVAERVVRWVSNNAEEYGYDREAVGLYGVSAANMFGSPTIPPTLIERLSSVRRAASPRCALTTGLRRGSTTTWVPASRRSRSSRSFYSSVRSARLCLTLHTSRRWAAILPTS